MTFLESIATCTKKTFVKEGRASLSEFWWFQSLYYMCLFIGWLNHNVINSDPLHYFILTILIFYCFPVWSVIIRRLHDLNKTGSTFLLIFIPIAGPIILIFMLMGAGTKGRNKFGPDPLAKKTKRKKR
tara:strand:- start:614 stop:997 length:384 start_codon:yes stop_codon:yes gene_type:complete